jgi:hypothetical protein
MLKTLFFALYALAGLSLAAPVFAQTSSPPAITVNGASPAQAMTQGDATQDEPPVDDKNIYCPTALEQILPGDYYACAAHAAYGRENYHKMVELLEESAYWANKDAQYVLGLTYFNGDDTPDVPQNRPLGLAWLALAAERKNKQYVLTYSEASARATPAELREAQVLLGKMKLKYGDSVAATRAIKRFNHNIQDIDDAAREGGTTYLNGYTPFPESAITISNKLHDEATTDFDSVNGTVVVGKPEWLQPPSADKPPAAQTTQP